MAAHDAFVYAAEKVSMVKLQVFLIVVLTTAMSLAGCGGGSTSKLEQQLKESEDRVAELARLEAENKSLKLEVENLKLRMQLAGTKDPSTSVTNVLTDEIARRVIDGGYNGDLSKFTFIEEIPCKGRRILVLFQFARNIANTIDLICKIEPYAAGLSAGVTNLVKCRW